MISNKLEYKMVENTLNRMTNKAVDIKTYVHSLPWQKLYFYITENEYHDIRKIHHTAKVVSARVKITNLGNRTPFVTGTQVVSYANANSQTTIGIWEHLESLGMAIMGKQIDSEFLYGKPISSLPSQTQIGEIPASIYGATSQQKIIDNRCILRYNLGYSEGNGSEEGRYESNDRNVFIPALLMQGGIYYNATNSVGQIYEKTYKPQDGRFHIMNNGFYHGGISARTSSFPVNLEQLSGNIQETRTARPGILTLPDYEDALIDNIRFAGLDSNPSSHIGHSLGIGIVPLLHKDGKLEEALLDLLIETNIEIEAYSMGTNLLYKKCVGPQPNTYAVGLYSYERDWHDAYGAGGKPIVGYRHEEDEFDDDPYITTDNTASRDSAIPGTTQKIMPERIPGQKRITRRMTKNQRRDICTHNLIVRKAYIEKAKEQGINIEMIRRQNLQYAIPVDASRVPADSDAFWQDINKIAGGLPVNNEFGQGPTNVRFHDEL
jgi:hypothetical protein